MNLRYKFVFGRSTKMVLIPVSQEKIPSIKEEWQTTIETNFPQKKVCKMFLCTFFEIKHFLEYF